MSCFAHVIRHAAVVLVALLVLPAPAYAAQSELVIVKKESTGASQYHRPGCPAVRDTKDVLAMTRAEAESRGSKAHPDCDPSAASAPGAPPAAVAGAQGKPDAAEEPVFIDASGAAYHRQGCAKMGGGQRKVLLKDVAKRWPCASCRPPIRKRAETPLVPGWRPRQG